MAASLSTGPYVLQPLVEDLPLSAEGDGADIKINCVEFYGQSFKISYSTSAHQSILLVICISDFHIAMHILADTIDLQIRTSMSVLLPQKSSISSRYPLILPNLRAGPPI